MTVSSTTPYRITRRNVLYLRTTLVSFQVYKIAQYLTSPKTISHLQRILILFLSNMASTTPFLTAVAARRSVYALDKTSPIPNAQIVSIVTQALTHAPSPFNVRSARCIVLFGDEHTKLWQATYKITEEASPQAIGILGPKIKSYEEAYGTVSSHFLYTRT
jgi:hypothetical protein